MFENSLQHNSISYRVNVNKRKRADTYLFVLFIVINLSETMLKYGFNLGVFVISAVCTLQLFLSSYITQNVYIFML